MAAMFETFSCSFVFILIVGAMAFIALRRANKALDENEALRRQLDNLRRMNAVAFGLDHELRAAAQHKAPIGDVAQVAGVADAFLRDGLLVRLAIADVIDKNLRAGKANLARLAVGQLVARSAVGSHRLAD